MGAVCWGSGGPRECPRHRGARPSRPGAGAGNLLPKIKCWSPVADGSEAWQSALGSYVTSWSSGGPERGSASVHPREWAVEAADSGANACASSLTNSRRRPNNAYNACGYHDRRRRLGHDHRVLAVAVVDTISLVRQRSAAASIESPGHLTQTDATR